MKKRPLTITINLGKVNPAVKGFLREAVTEMAKAFNKSVHEQVEHTLLLTDDQEGFQGHTLARFHLEQHRRCIGLETPKDNAEGDEAILHYMRLLMFQALKNGLSPDETLAKVQAFVQERRSSPPIMGDALPKLIADFQDFVSKQLAGWQRDGFDPETHKIPPYQMGFKDHCVLILHMQRYLEQAERLGFTADGAVQHMQMYLEKGNAQTPPTEEHPKGH